MHFNYINLQGGGDYQGQDCQMLISPGVGESWLQLTEALDNNLFIFFYEHYKI